VTAAGSVRHAFVTPALAGPPTGGTLYNAQLIAALARAGIDCRHYELARLPADAEQAGRVLWIDSLYLDALPALRERTQGALLQLVLHYLPTLVTLGREPARSELSLAERRALDVADGFLVTSTTMQAALQALGAGDRPILRVEPGSECPAPTAGAAPHRRAAVGALMLCSVVEGKGVLALLRELADAAVEADDFTLAIAGRTDAEPEYARACAELIAGRDALRGRVRLLGPLPHARGLAELAAADVLLSASRMEAYGMALAEARACGVPVVARQGGHAAAHVDAAAGGELVRDEAAVARSFLALVRDRAQLAERKRRAAGGARMRSWNQAAAEWIEAVSARLPEPRDA
jgi:glycosyltransferase involved in cell wall biosynthesis